MTMHYVGQRIIAGYIYLKNTLFQKPTFEWVWRLIMMASSVSSSRFRSPHLSGYGDSIFHNHLTVIRFQKPTFEWVWRLQRP